MYCMTSNGKMAALALCNLEYGHPGRHSWEPAGAGHGAGHGGENARRVNDVPARNVVPDSPAAFGEAYVSYALRQHLSAAHRLPAGRAYLVPRQELAAFHAQAHAAPGRVRGWLRVRRLARARKGAR